MIDFSKVTVGLTQAFDCNYLTTKKEQLLVIRDSRCHTDLVYEQLMARGFRRSGNEIYRPHCPGCQACQSIRIPVAAYKPSRSQKRVINKGKRTFSATHTDEPDKDSYALYEKYINLRHSDGSMYPSSVEQYDGFLFCEWLDTLFINLWHKDKLVAVAVTDVLPNALSAIYTFFDPDYEHYSLGSFSLINQIEACKTLKKDYLYLGYQIDGCQKMNYKTKYKPYQRLIRAQWTNFE
ncbi:MAG: arginyltransferase [Algicola sp.]|nr:arginyltransferase [Algicola sp.]